MLPFKSCNNYCWHQFLVFVATLYVSIYINIGWQRKRKVHVYESNEGDQNKVTQ